MTNVLEFGYVAALALYDNGDFHPLPPGWTRATALPMDCCRSVPTYAEINYVPPPPVKTPEPEVAPPELEEPEEEEEEEVVDNWEDLDI